MKTQLKLLTLTLSLMSTTCFADNLPNAQTYSSLPYRGVSLSGAEFKDNSTGWVKAGNSVPNLNDAALFLYRGMNIYRIPVAWEYLANPDGSLITTGDYWANLQQVIQDLTRHGAYVLLDLHNYMRYNPTDVSQDYNSSNMNIIGSGNSNAPTQQAYATLWSNLAKQFQDSHMIFGLMNEPHDMDSRLVLDNENAAIKAIRVQEQTQSNPPHLILVEGNYWSGMHSWFDTTRGKANSDTFVANNIHDSANHYAIEVHQYFDSDSSGQYLNPLNDCTTDASQYVNYVNQMASWATQNKTAIFLGELGAPDTPTCHTDITALLDAINNHAASTTNPYAFLGWSVWSAGHAWGNYLMSVAPGGPVNNEMWEPDLYMNSKYLTQVANLPALGPAAAKITNHSGKTLLFSSGNWPFQVQGSASLNDGQSTYLYSDNATLIPSNKLLLTYHTDPDNLSDVLGIGINNGWGFGFQSSTTTVTADSSCEINPPNGDLKRCWTVN